MFSALHRLVSTRQKEIVSTLHLSMALALEIYWKLTFGYKKMLRVYKNIIAAPTRRSTSRQIIAKPAGNQWRLDCFSLKLSSRLYYAAGAESVASEFVREVQI